MTYNGDFPFLECFQVIFNFIFHHPKSLKWFSFGHESCRASSPIFKKYKNLSIAFMELKLWQMQVKDDFRVSSWTIFTPLANSSKLTYNQFFCFKSWHNIKEHIMRTNFDPRITHYHAIFIMHQINDQKVNSFKIIDPSAFEAQFQFKWSQHEICDWTMAKSMSVHVGIHGCKACDQIAKPHETC